jgi:hypothetical protein
MNIGLLGALMSAPLGGTLQPPSWRERLAFNPPTDGAKSAKRTGSGTRRCKGNCGRPISANKELCLACATKEHECK